MRATTSRPIPRDEDIEVTVTMNLAEAKIIRAFLGSINSPLYNQVRNAAVSDSRKILPADPLIGRTPLTGLRNALAPLTYE